jgi:leader peptidase (prepilin peptidase)/N-methyltransferase
MTAIGSGPLFALASLILGLVLGSFYNVCIHRYLEDESIVSPGSRCPGCGHPLAWWENIPLISFVILGGRCRECKEGINWRYPVVEGISGLWALLLALKFGPGWAWLVYLLFGGLLIVMSFIDLESFILPDAMTLPGGVAALLCAAFLLDTGWSSAVLGAVIGAGAFFLLQKGYKLLRGVEGLGSGDVKLMFLLGGLLGWQSLVLVVFFGAISGLLVSLVYLLREGGEGMMTAIPFGPFLSLGGMLYILCGPEIWRWYLA